MINILPDIQSLNNLRDRTVREFERAVSLIEKLSDEVFLKTENCVGSIGAHFRHNIDFANNFLKGLGEGKIDYSNRERDVRIEENRDYAIEKIEAIIIQLKNLPPEILEISIAVSSEIDESLCHLSSISRELEFLHSHTVHHHAIIAEKLKHLGVELSADFGVAPSTLKYWADRQTDFLTS